VSIQENKKEGKMKGYHIVS